MIVLYSGRRGCGKTLTMTKDAYNFHRNGWRVYSNTELGFPHTLLSTDDILAIGKTDLENIVLVIDEIQVLIDSRRSARSGNLDFSYFIQQIRKRNIIILCTTQFSGTVDLRLRQHIDIIARPQFDKKLLVCRVTYVDVTATDPYDTLYEPKSVEVVYDARGVFDLYNTRNIVQAAVSSIKKEKKGLIGAP